MIRHRTPAQEGGEALCVAAAGGRELAWDGCVNVRDLGGLGQVRPGSVVRMEAPGRLTEAAWAAAWAYGFAAMKEPGLLAADVRQSFRQLR